MRKILFAIALLVSLLANSQRNKIPIAVINDFSINFYQKQRIEKNQTLSAWAHLAGSRIGYGYIDTEIAIEKLDKDEKFREELWKTFWDLGKQNSELLEMNLFSLGMSAVNARVLKDYIVVKYSATKKPETEVESKNVALNLDKYLPEPRSLLKLTYMQIVDSLDKHKIDYRVDSSFGEDYFIGFNLTTNDGQYSFSDKYVTGSYTFKIQASIEDIKRALAAKKIQVKKLEEDYYQCTYKGYTVTFLKWEDQVTDITYNRIISKN